jgi:FtsZ-binding cell division protein ZapB
MRTSNKTLADALRILAQDIESPDGVANAAIQEAADRIDELAFEVEDLRNQNHSNRISADVRWEEIQRLKERIKRLEEAGDSMAKWLDRNTPVTVRFDWSAAKEDKL